MFIRCKQRKCICFTDVHKALDEITLDKMGAQKIGAIFEKNYSKWVYGILSVNHYIIRTQEKKGYIVCSMPRITVS